MIVSNRSRNIKDVWGFLHGELSAKVIVFEFKCYDKEDIGKDEISQVNEYIKSAWGKLGFLICNKNPIKQAHLKKLSIFNNHKNVILILLDTDLIKMLDMKIKGENPEDHIWKIFDDFYYELE